LKIVSLLPSATEIVFALGLGDELDGVSFECDYPEAARTKTVVSGTALRAEQQSSARDVDDAVTARVHAGQPIYTLDAPRIREIGPDLILAQDLCEVCAVPSGAVEDALDVIGCTADVLSLDPSSLDEVIGCIGAVGEATGTNDRASTLMTDLRDRVTRVREAVSGRVQPRTLALEWSDPPYSGGHWVPDMIAAAGGEPVLARSGERSRRLEWSEIAGEDIDVVLFMPCGYGLAEAAAEGMTLLERPELARASALYALDATAYFSRPGPRVVDGVETLASLLHPGAVPDRRAEAVRLAHERPL
jgi:iron complex transport system substrate-binding protein